MLGFKSAKAKASTEAAIKRSAVWRCVRKSTYAQRKQAYQVKAKGLSKNEAEELQKRSIIAFVRKMKYGGCIISYKTAAAAAARRAVQSGIRIGRNTYFPDPYVSQPKVGCINCGKLDHKKCQRKLCWRCGKDDHIQKNCTEETQKCVNCGKAHLRKDYKAVRKEMAAARGQKRRTYLNAFKFDKSKVLVKKTRPRQEENSQPSPVVVNAEEEEKKETPIDLQ